MTAPIIPADQWPDEFNGDNAKLVSCINALLSMDAAGALAPHGIGGHARGLLSAAAHRLALAPSIDLELVREAVEVAITHAGPNDGSLAGWQHLLALIDGQAHYGHGAGDVAGGPRDSDCSCRGTPQQEACANHGCGFCRATHAAQPTKGEGVLVPVEPTQAMLEAFNDWRPTEGNNYAGAQSVSAQGRWEFRQRYAAMLAAAPQQPAGVDEAAAIRAFEEHYGESADDPCVEGELELWLAAWRKALAAQQGGRADG